MFSDLHFLSAQCVAHAFKVAISADALRMRTRRLCEVKASGRAQVEPKIIEQYKQGGEQREILEMALLESLSRYGLDRSQYRRVKARRGDTVYGSMCSHAMNWPFVKQTYI